MCSRGACDPKAHGFGSQVHWGSVPDPSRISSLIWHLGFPISSKRIKWSLMSMVAPALHDPTASRSSSEVNSPTACPRQDSGIHEHAQNPVRCHLPHHGPSSTLREAKGRQGISLSSDSGAIASSPGFPTRPGLPQSTPCPPSCLPYGILGHGFQRPPSLSSNWS